MIKEFYQVIRHLPNGEVKTYKIKRVGGGTENDPLTTIELE